MRIRSTIWPALLVTIIVVIAAFALRIYDLNGPAIWHDEGWSIRAFRGPFTTPDDNTPFVYYLAGHVLWRAGAGETPLALRYVSVLLGVIVTAGVLRIGWRWYGPLAGLSAGLLAAGIPLLWAYSIEVRAYIAVPLVALALIIGADMILRRKPGEPVPRRAWAWIFVAQVIGLYTHNLTVPLIVWLNAALGLAWLYRRDWRRMIAWAGLELVVIACYIPWLLTQSPSGTPLNTPPELGLTLIRDIWASYFLPVMPQLMEAPERARQGVDILTPIMMYGFLGMVATLGLLWRRRTHRTWILLSHALLVPVFSTALLIAANIDFHPRYYIAAVPGTILLMIGGVRVLVPRLPDDLPWNLFKWEFSDLRQLRIQIVGYTLLAGGGLVLAYFSLTMIFDNPTYQHDDFAGLAEYYATLPDDHVIVIPFDAERALQDYYAGAAGISARFVNIPLYADEATALEAINALGEGGPQAVEFLTWFQLPADARGMYPCLLHAAHTGPEAPEVREFFGLRTERYIIEPITLTDINAAPTYAEMSLTSAAYAASAHGACVRTDWTLTNNTTDEAISVSMTVHAPDDSVIARHDAGIARDDNARTNRWEAGESGSAYHLLKLPPGAPLDEYVVRLNLYSFGQPSGFDLLGAGGQPAGKIYTLPAALTLHGPPLKINATTLVEDNALDETRIETGRPLTLTLALASADEAIIISLRGDDWSLEQTLESGDQPRLSWHTFTIPPGSTGEAILMVDDETLKRYDVIDVERVFELPGDAIPVDVAFRDAGRLAGYIVADEAISMTDMPEITLIWQGTTPTERAYTVFAQIIGADGRLVAQSDMQPSMGARPTTGWVEGEYIIDTHQLNIIRRDYSGEAHIIAGLYDADDGFRRILTEAGENHARLPLTLTISGE